VPIGIASIFAGTIVVDDTGLVAIMSGIAAILSRSGFLFINKHFEA